MIKYSERKIKLQRYDFDFLLRYILGPYDIHKDTKPEKKANIQRNWE